MEYLDPEDVTPASSPLLVPRQLSLDGPKSLTPWIFDPQINPHHEPWELDNLLENEFLNLPLRYDSASRETDVSDTEAELHRTIGQESSSFNEMGEKAATVSSFTNDKTAELITLAPRRPRMRLGLPLIVFTNNQENSVIACPDSGSDVNIMSWKIADQFGLQIMDIQDSEPSTFTIADGRKVSAVGQVRLKCAFKQGSPATAIIDCVCYVFPTLAVPMIMGIEFLHATGTLTKHRDRLSEVPVPSMQALRVCSVGRPKRNFICRVGNYVTCATADTGSDLDLVSPEFALSRPFEVANSCVEVEFADGSKGHTVGMIKPTFSIGRVSEVEGFIRRSKEVSLELFILDNLNAEILIGMDTVEDLQAFSRHEDCFIPAVPRMSQSDLNIIRYVGAMERGFTKIREFLKVSFASPEKKQATATSQDHKRKWLQQKDQLLHDQLDNQNRLQPTERIQRPDFPHSELSLPFTGSSLGPEALSPPALFNDPLERPYSPTEYVSPETLPSDLHPRGRMAPHTVLLPPSPLYRFPLPLAHRPNMDCDDDLTAQYDSDTDNGELILDEMHFANPAAIGQYHCRFEGCRSPPFQTQYLLTCHANIHSQARPYYCPVNGCPRGEGRKGFKRKNEMIRHGLLHESPGYLCPFCPDKEYKYPSPNNLQRHVLVHHLDRDEDDVLLKDVLDQPPDGPGRGRPRRRGL